MFTAVFRVPAYAGKCRWHFCISNTGISNEMNYLLVFRTQLTSVNLVPPGRSHPHRFRFVEENVSTTSGCRAENHLNNSRLSRRNTPPQNPVYRTEDISDNPGSLRRNHPRNFQFIEERHISPIPGLSDRKHPAGIRRPGLKLPVLIDKRSS